MDSITTADLAYLLPLLVLFGGAILALLAAGMRSRNPAGLLSQATLIAAAVCLFLVPQDLPRQVTPLFVVDQAGLLFAGLILLSALTVALLAHGSLARESRPQEFFVLLLLATLGACALAMSRHFVSLFVSLEVLTVSLYGLIGYPKKLWSIEASLKYLVLAAASAAFMLFGMALIYAATGKLEFNAVAGLSGPLASAGLGLLLVGVGFKLAVVPFHLWTPDVYEGAPAPVTAFVASVSKGGMVAALLRLSAMGDLGQSPAAIAFLSAVAVMSMLIGNWLALLQGNLKRLLAYSSIAHLGYLLVAVIAGGPVAAAFYLVAYTITTLGAFGVLSVIFDRDREVADLAQVQGLMWKKPWLATILASMLLSLAGIPLTGGFTGKFLVIGAGAQSGMWILVFFLAVGSALGIYYYLRVIVALFGKPGEEDAIMVSSWPRAGLESTVLAGLLVALLWLGTHPGPFLSLLEKAVASLA